MARGWGGSARPDDAAGRQPGHSSCSTPALAAQRRKLRLGEYHPEHFTLREARGRAIEELAAINHGADPVADAEVRANALTFKALAEKFLAEAPHLAATTRGNYRQYLEKDVYPGHWRACQRAK